MKTNLGISDQSAKAVVSILNTILSDEYLLYTKTRNFHWNVTGPNFSELHKLFELQYTELNIIVDDTAERARSLGGRSLGTMMEFLKNTSLKESPGVYPDAKKMVAILLADHEAIIQKLRKDLADCAEKYHDMGTSDFLTGIMEQHEKTAWMLRAYLG